MTEPTTSTQDVAAISASAQAVIDMAAKLGVSWVLRIATVTQASQAATVGQLAPKVTFDGDITAIGATSMVGSVSSGQRVYVIQVPPSGNFIVGWAMGPFFARQTVSGSTSSLAFPLPTNLRRFTVYYSARSDAAANIVGVTFRVGGDASAVYSSQVVFGTNATPQAAASAAGTSGQMGLATGALAPGSVYSSGQATFYSWDLTSHFPSYDYESTVIGSGVANFRHDSGGGAYLGSGNRTSLTILCASGNFIAGTDFQLEGVAT